jgi:exonuclease III
MPTDDKVLLQ